MEAALVTKFMSLFKGLDRAYGVYDLKSQSTRKDGKKTGAARTLHRPLTRANYEDHLSGKRGLGVIPITDDNTVAWAAIDIDVYDLDHAALVEKIQDLHLPLWVFRTKSGGAHVYVFFTEFVDAGGAQDFMRETAVELGFGGSEIFPKQKQLASKKDVGNWLNMPYLGCSTDRCLITADGPQPIEAALDLISPIEWEDVRDIQAGAGADALPDGPPCLNHLCRSTFPPGTRNNGLFNLAVYARKVDPKNWRSKVDDYNSRFMDPPLSAQEVVNVCNSLERKQYEYTCSGPPIAEHCDKLTCGQRKYGVRGASALPTLNNLTKFDTDPPLYFIDVGDLRLELSLDDLESQNRFRKRCLAQLNILPGRMKGDDWDNVVRSLLENLTIVEMPEDVTEKAQLSELIERFCLGRAQALDRSGLLQGKPWTHDDVHEFRLSDLQSFLGRAGLKDVKRNVVVKQIKEMGGQHDAYRIDGRNVNVWKLPRLSDEESDSETARQELDDDVL